MLRKLANVGKNDKNSPGQAPDGLPVALDTVNFSTAEKLLGHCSRAVMFINTNVKLV